MGLLVKRQLGLRASSRLNMTNSIGNRTEFWQTKYMIFQQRRECFCAFCKTPRKVYKSKYLSVISILGLIGLSLVLSEVLWKTLDPRGLVILGIMLLVGELFSQAKWRQSMVCQNCGFDLILFKKSPEKAGVKIKEFLELRSERPEFLLKRSPQIPKQTVTQQSIQESKQKGTKLSLHG